MMKLKTNSYVVIIVLFLLGAVMPLVLRRYNLFMLAEIVIFVLYAVSYNLLLGYAGLLSFGHAMFFGLGAFVAAVSIIHIPGLTLLSAVIISLVITTIAGFLIGGLLLRHKGAYFALLTMAFNALFYAVATKWHSVTGGDDGLSISRPDLDLGFASLPCPAYRAFIISFLSSSAPRLSSAGISRTRPWGKRFFSCGRTRSA